MRRGGRTLSVSPCGRATVSLRLGHAAALTATGCHSLPRRRFATSGERLGERRPLPKGAEAPNGRYRDIGAPPRLRDSVRPRLSARSAPLPLRGTGHARKGKVFHKRKTVGFPLVWRSFRPFLSTWREKDIPLAAGEPHPPLRNESLKNKRFVDNQTRSSHQKDLIKYSKNKL